MHPAAVLAVLCLCVFAVNVDTTMVNVTLPTLVTELGASTRELQWIVDAYNLTFAALVLAAGSVSDRFGRVPALAVGLGIYGIGNALAALTGSSGELIAVRALTGLGAAIVFPTTLSIITNVFTGRAARAKAIGIWSATTGLAVAVGPITGGLVLRDLDWESNFLVKAPLAVVAIGLVLLLVPSSRDPEQPPLDVPGLALSAAGLAALVYTIIEAPERGWLAPATITGFTLTALLLLGFAVRERRADHPMLDVALFRNPRFSAASLSVTVAFFALFGFIFLITQYFQFLRSYSPLETGVRILPVALSIAVASVAGTRIVVRLGNKMVVAGGLTLLTVSYLWISTVSAVTPYPEIAGQMVLLGLGMGFTSAPATESIMGAVSTAKAGVGSAVNDATRELGGTLGVAVIGSVFASLYAAQIDLLAGSAPGSAVTAARDSVGGALVAAGQLREAGATGLAAQLLDGATAGFFDGLQAGCLVAAAITAAGAVFAGIALPARPRAQTGDRVHAGQEAA